jgi:hypothetical protein
LTIIVHTGFLRKGFAMRLHRLVHSPQLIPLVCTLLCGAWFANAAQAGVFVFNTSDSQITPGFENLGWWSDTQINSNTNENYGTGQSTFRVRNFFTFDLSSLSGTVVSATLELTRYRYISPDPTETIEFFDVSTPAATLNTNDGTSTTIYSDLGSGTSYGSFVVPRYTDSSTETLSFSLNAAAAAAISASNPGYFSIGGSLTTVGLAGTEILFGLSQGSGIQRLIVETADSPGAAAVPEASSLFAWSLVGLFGLAFASARVRRNRKEFA